MDPLTIAGAIGVASKAFNAIKQGFAVGQDLDQMAGQIGKWMSAVSDVDQAEKEAKNPPLFKKLMYASSIEQQALEAFAAKKKLEQQRAELKQYLILSFGPSAWNELLHMEGTIRKERQEMIYKRKERIHKIVNGIAIGVLTLTIIGFIFLLIYLWKERN
jgi:preprotein translocase subunit SecA|tara:strand:+ start:103 stop:582 length:480 start_codon:yes stop_codon:yes gene_type:complete